MTDFYNLVPAAAEGRFDGIERPYTPDDVKRLRGSVQIRQTLAENGANRLWKLLHEESYVNALGAMTRNRDDSKAGKLQADVQAIYKEIADHNASAAPADRIVISRQTIKTQMQRELGGAPAGFGRERKQARGSRTRWPEAGSGASWACSTTM